ncbi:MAG: protein-L-isoaspartate O-methyltransferase [Proteobacteria bacterium]|nr:MAG: protein-L-isoaspartate O-methyltransferase [Pseudomonadota bacterium]QKK10227.1 MAG: protein-L-isoaspartate O-methyltransferase [Pseudomonadota bacterium]
MTETNLDQARYNMIEQQIRPWEVLNDDVLKLMTQVPREHFVPEEYRKLAFADTEIPLGNGQVMMAPRVEARFLQALALKPTDHVLEVGTGSGYMTACLARSAAHVYSVDIYDEFTGRATGKLHSAGVHNVTLETGDAAVAWDDHAPYDAIVITGALRLIPEAYQAQLRPEGRLIALVGASPVRQALLITRTGENAWSTEALFETDLPELVNAPQPQSFVF